MRETFRNILAWLVLLAGLFAICAGSWNLWKTPVWTSADYTFILIAVLNLIFVVYRTKG